MTTVRSSKARDQRYWSAQQEIASRWAKAAREFSYISEVHGEIATWLKTLDVTATQYLSLCDANWASRELTLKLFEHWQLYTLDGEPITKEQICALTAAGHDYPKLRGRFEWKGSNHIPLYDSKEPEIL